MHCLRETLLALQIIFVSSKQFQIGDAIYIVSSSEVKGFEADIAQLCESLNAAPATFETLDTFKTFSSGWSFLEGVACKNGEGAINGEILENLDVVGCRDSCSAESSCEGVVRRKSEATTSGKCWHKKNVDLDICETNSDSYDMHNKAQGADILPTKAWVSKDILNVAESGYYDGDKDMPFDCVSFDKSGEKLVLENVEDSCSSPKPVICKIIPTTTTTIKTTNIEKLWRDDGRCGESFPLPNGKPGQCDPTANENEKGPCCSSLGYCGNTDAHCKCPSCVNYAAAVETGDGWRFTSSTIEALATIEASIHTECCAKCKETTPDTGMYNFNKNDKKCFCRKQLPGVTPGTEQKSGLVAEFCHKNAEQAIDEDNNDSNGHNFILRESEPSTAAAAAAKTITKTSTPSITKPQSLRLYEDLVPMYRGLMDIPCGVQDHTWGNTLRDCTCHDKTKITKDDFLSGAESCMTMQNMSRTQFTRFNRIEPPKYCTCWDYNLNKHVYWYPPCKGNRPQSCTCQDDKLINPSIGQTCEFGKSPPKICTCPDGTEVDFLKNYKIFYGSREDAKKINV